MGFSPASEAPVWSGTRRRAADSCSNGAAEIIFKRDIKTPEDAERYAEEYRQKFANPFKAAEMGYIDDVFEPRYTRPRLISALSLLRTKVDRNPPKKHGNIPL